MERCDDPHRADPAAAVADAYPQPPHYRLDDSLIGDHEWQRRADELAALQQQLFMPIGWYDEAFADWTGATGCHLPLDEWVSHKSMQLVRLHEQRVSFL